MLVGEARHEPGHRGGIEVVEQLLADRLGEEQVALVEQRGEPLAGLGERPVLEVAPELEDADDAIEPARERPDPTADALLELAHLAPDALGLRGGSQAVVELWVAKDRVEVAVALWLVVMAGARARA